MKVVSLLLLLFISTSVYAFSKSVIIKGSKSFNSSALYDAMGLKLPPWYKFWKPKTVSINEKLIPSIEESIGDFYKSEGFYHAKIDKKENNNSVTFSIDEGKSIKVNSIDINSNFDISSIVTLKKDQRFRPVEFTNIKRGIKKLLLKKGYCNYDLNTKAMVDIKKNIADITYKLDKKNLCRFGKIIIQSPPNIKEKIVKSRLLFDTNQTYSSEKIDKSYSMISGLEAFDAINLKKTKSGSNIDVNLSLRERKKRNHIELGLGYETNIGPRGVFRYQKQNFRGDAKKIAFDFKYSNKEKYATNILYWPAFVKIPFIDNFYLDLKNEFTYSKIEYDNFLERKYLNYLHLLKDYDWLSVDLGLAIENINIIKSAKVCNIIDGAFNLFFPFLKVIVDFRDSKINPKNGIYISQYIESGLSLLKDSSNYTKLITEGRLIKSVGRLTFSVKGKLGLVEEFTNKLPQSKLFFAGGAFSNRGYGYNSLGAFDGLCNNMGAKTFVDTSLEMNYPIYKNIGGAIFFDSTLLSSNSHRFSIDFIHSIGFGLRYLTAIGPIKIDYGMDIKKHSQHAIHFQIGQSF